MGLTGMGLTGIENLAIFVNAIIILISCCHIHYIFLNVWVLWDPHILKVRKEDAYRSCARYFLLSMCPEREKEREDYCMI